MRSRITETCIIDFTTKDLEYKHFSLIHESFDLCKKAWPSVKLKLLSSESIGSIEVSFDNNYCAWDCALQVRKHLIGYDWFKEV